MKVDKIKIRKMIVESIRKNIIEMPVRDLTVAQEDPENKDSYVFSDDFPEDKSAYDEQLIEDVPGVQHIKDYLKKTPVDVDIIILPDNIIKSMLSSDVVVNFSSRGIGITDTSAIIALFEGKYKKYKQVIEKIDPKVLTIIMQKHRKSGQENPDLSAGEYSLDWHLHDGIGHVSQDNFTLKYLLKSMLGIPFDLLQTFTGLDLNPIERDDTIRRIHNPREFITKIESPATTGLGQQGFTTTSFGPEPDRELRMEFRKDLLKFFKSKNFTASVGYEDAHASIMAYYFVHRVLPDPFLNKKYVPSLFTLDELQKFKQQSDNAFKELAGKTLIFNFIKRAQPHESQSGIDQITKRGF